MSNVPPKMPGSAPEIERVIQLLNLRAQADLEKAEQIELKELLGVYPTPAQAVAWKQSIRRIRDATDPGAKSLDEGEAQTDGQEVKTEAS